MAKAKNARQIIILESTAGTGYRYTTKKNKRNPCEYLPYDIILPSLATYSIILDTRDKNIKIYCKKT